MVANKKQLSHDQQAQLIRTLKARFDKHEVRHKEMDWVVVQRRLEANAPRLWSLQQMEATGGEPDVVDYDKKSDEVTFMDCSAESPAGRRSLCYDRESLDARKENKPAGSVLEMADHMGIELLTEAQYRELQQLGVFDSKTSSWVQTPAPIRKLGWALFCDRRYDTVFVYHNGASSYYAARGFRGMMRV